MWTVAYHLKPLQVQWLPFGMRVMSFNASFRR